ncbi:MAG TPA: PAS domain S-box protein, partial [Methanoregulaceae archaeon]|nr:PAS domain S-box protein [Methanoregulaceae archaeon]
PFVRTEMLDMPLVGRRWLYVRIFRMSDGLGILTTDITAQKQGEDELRAAYEQLTATEEELRANYEELAASEARLRKSEASIAGLFDAAPVGIGVVKDRVLLRVNERLCRMTGYPREELEGKNTRFLYLDDADYAAAGRMREQAYRQDAPPDSIEVHWKRKDGSVFDVRINAAVTDRSDPAAPMIYSALDVTGKNREHAELLEAYRKVSATEEELKHRYDELAQSGQRILKSEAEIAGILRAAPVGIGLVKGRVLKRVNDKFCGITGYPPEELLGREARFLYPDDDEYRKAGKFYTLGTGRNALTSVETRFLRKDGMVRDIQLFGTLIDPDNEAAGHIFAALDITEEKKTREALRAAYEKIALSEEELRNQFEELARSEQELRRSENAIAGILRAAPVGIAVVDDRIFRQVNDHLCRIIGYSRGEIEGRSTRFIYPDDREYDRVAEFYSSGNHGNSLETRFLCKDGTVREIQIFGTRIDPANSESGMIFTALDITDRKKSEDALRESEEKYRTLIERAGEAITILQDGLHVYVNPRMASLVGIPVQDLLGRSFLNGIWPDDRELLRTRYAQRCAGEDVPDSYDFRLIGPGGKALWVHLSVAKIPWQGRPATLYMMTDITGLKEAEATLAENQQRMMRVLEKEPLAAAFVNNDGNVVFINERFRQVFGYSKDDIPTLDAWWPLAYPDPAYRNHVREAWTSALSQSADRRQGFGPAEYTITTKSGEERVAETSGITFDDGFLATFVDITERRKAEEALKKNGEKFRIIAENMADQVTRIDRNRTILYATPSVFRQTGFPQEDYTGTDITLYLHPEDRDRVIRDVQAAIGRHSSQVMIEFRYRHQDGTYHWYESETRLLYDAAGEYDGAIFAAREITRRKLTEEALQESEKRLNLAMEATSDGIFDWDMQKGTSYFSPRYLTMLGYGEDELPQSFWTWEGLLHPDDRDRALSVVSEYRTGKRESHAIEFRLRAKDGSWRWILSKAKLHGRTSDGAPIRMVGTHTDITDRKHAEEELLRSETKYRHILENMQDAYFQTDTKGIVTMANPSAARLYRYDSPDAMAGVMAVSLYKDLKLRAEILRKLEQAGGVIDITGQARRRDGTTFWASMNIQIRFDENGRVLGTEAIVRDITERRMMEQVVTTANRKLNLLNAITRHDIVNQVAILNGYAKLARMKGADPVVTEFLAKMEAAGAAIEHQVEFTKMYQELGVKAPSWQDLGGLVSGLHHPGIRFVTACSGTEVFADPMLEKVFSNLLDNSVRHGVRVSEISISCGTEDDTLTILWEDNGMGIPDEDKEKIFERGHGKHTGLGLFLVREILDITGITITETGVAGNGARFE